MARNALIKHRGDTGANWTAANPVLAARELAVETDTAKLKIGDGATAWNTLPYVSAAASVADGSITPAKQANVATATVFYRKTAGSGPPEVQTLATLKADLALTKADVGLPNADNTSDVNKPVSTAQQAALDLKANLASPALTGTPSAPTAAAATNSTQLATTAFVHTAVANLINSAPGALDTLDEIAAALGDDANFAASVTTSLAGKQGLDATLTALAGLAGGANKLPYFTGTDVLAQTDLSPFGRSLIDDADAAAARTTLGLGSAATLSTADIDERARDALGTALTAGSGISITPNDGGDTITIAATGGGGADPWTYTILASDVSNSTTAMADVTGLSFSATANKTYMVEAVGALQSAATTTGMGLALDLPAGASVIGLVIQHTGTTAIGGIEQIADDANTNQTAGVRAATTNSPFRAKWIVAIGATAGTVQLRFRSEIAASQVTLMANLTVFGSRLLN